MSNPISTLNWAHEQRRLSAEDQKLAEIDRRFSIGARDGQSCEGCRFWDGKKYGDGTWAPSRCLRHAPTGGERWIAAESPMAHDPSNKNFPTTLRDDWCGDFESVKPS